VITKLDVGGAQTVAITLASHAVAAGHQVTMFAGPDPGSGGDLRGVVRSRGIELVELSSLRHQVRPVDEVRALLTLRTSLQGRFDVVHTHSSKAGVIGRAAAAAVRTPVIVHHVHGWSFRPYQPAIGRLTYVVLERLAARVTDCVIHVSDADLAEGMRYRIVPTERTCVLPTPVDLERFYPRTSRTPDGGRTVITVTRLGSPKDTATLLRAVSAMKTAVHLDIVGGGPERAALEALARRLGVGQRVRFLGVRDDVPDLLARSDVFVLSSQSEGMPTAIVEAMAAGVPVVATDVGGVAQVLNHGRAGRLVPPGDPSALAAAMDELFDNPSVASAFRRAGLETARRHDATDAGRTVLGLYRTVLEGKVGRRPAPRPED
jgi:glycosyltransferase involved in cell wall biosynthesis